jgi:hypothetical protein
MYIWIHDPEGVREYGKHDVASIVLKKTMPAPYVKYNL